MFFWILLLAHEIGDFPLQTDFIYKLKRTYSWGVIPHVLVCSLANLIALLPFIANIKIWLAIIVLGIVHYLLDRGKIIVFTQANKDNFFNFILDQILHILSIWLVATWLTLELDYFSFDLSPLYYNSRVLIASSVVIFAAFAGTPIIYFFFTYWHKKKQLAGHSVEYPGFKEKLPGLTERAFASILIITGWPWLLFTPVIFAPTFFLGKKPLLEKTSSAVIGFLLCLFCAALFHLTQ